MDKEIHELAKKVISEIVNEAREKDNNRKLSELDKKLILAMVKIIIGGKKDED